MYDTRTYDFFTITSVLVVTSTCTPAPNRLLSAGDANGDGTYTAVEGFNSLFCGCLGIENDDQPVGNDPSSGTGGGAGGSESGDTWYTDMG